MKISLFTTKSILGCLIFSLMMVSQVFAGNVYYVDAQNGNDSNSGTESLPWKTIQKAANTMAAGDTAIIKAGTYNERVTVALSGSAGNLITFRANAGDRVTVDGGFTITGNYIKIDRLRVTGASTCNWQPTDYNIYIDANNVEITDIYCYEAKHGGIHLSSDSSNCKIKNSEFYKNGGCGLDVRGKNHTINFNEIHDSRCSPCGSDADAIDFFGSGHTFKGNYIHDISYTNNPGHLPHIDAFQTYTDQHHAGAQNCILEQNYIDLPEYKDANAATCGFMLRDCSNLIIKNNIIKAFRATNTGGGNCNKIKILNNTVIGNLNYSKNYGPEGINVKYTSNCVVKNNIVCEQKVSPITTSGANSLDTDYNCTYNSDGSTPPGTAQPNDLWGINPNFTSFAKKNYHLQSNSLCINTGETRSEVPKDYDGVSRPQGPWYDIGSYEYKGEVVSSHIPVASFTAYPLEGIPPLEVNFDASASYDSDGNITSYEWDFGDGSTGSGITVTHTYEDRGNYTAKLSVTDNDEQSDFASQGIKVGTPPVALFEAFPTSGNTPLKVEFDASVSYDTDGEIVSYKWNFGDGTTGTGKKVFHTYFNYGDHTATLKITDDDGFSNATSQKIKVVEKPYPPLNVKVRRVTNKGNSFYGYCRVEWRKNPKNFGRHNIVKYRIYRKIRHTDNGAFVLIKEVSYRTLKYADKSIENIKELNLYAYAVSAVDDKNKESELGEATYLR